jgi:hypothetical protein
VVIDRASEVLTESHARAFADLTRWTHAWDASDAQTYVDRAGTTRVHQIDDRGNGDRPLVRDHGSWGAVLGHGALPGPRWDAASPWFNGRAALHTDEVHEHDGALWDLHAMLSPNADPHDSASWFPGGGYGPPYWVVNLGRLTGEPGSGFFDSFHGTIGTGPTIGAGIGRRRRAWSVSTYGLDDRPMHWINSPHPMRADETVLVIVFVSDQERASFIDVTWRGPKGRLRRARTSGHLDPYPYREVFVGYVHEMYLTAAGIKTGVPTETEIAAVRAWAAQFIPPRGPRPSAG